MPDDLTKPSFGAIEVAWNYFWERTYELNHLLKRYQELWIQPTIFQSLTMDEKDMSGRVDELDEILGKLDRMKPVQLRLLVDLRRMITSALVEGEIPSGPLEKALSLLPKDNLQIKLF